MLPSYIVNACQKHSNNAQIKVEREQLYRERQRELCLPAIAAAAPHPPPPSSSLPLTCLPPLLACLPWQLLTCWDQPLIYLERALKWRDHDEWHFNVLLRCLVTSTIDHSAAPPTPTPSLFHRPSHCPGGEVWLSGRK